MSSTTSKPKPVIIHDQDIANRAPERFPSPSPGGDVTWKTLISSPQTPTNTFTVGVATCLPGKTASCPAGHLKLHLHTHAELYHVISGQGIVTIEGEEYGVGKGSVVFIPGDAEHGMRCVGGEEVRWLYVFAAGGFGDVVYRFGEDGPGKVKERERAKL